MHHDENLGRLRILSIPDSLVRFDKCSQAFRHRASRKNAVLRAGPSLPVPATVKTPNSGWKWSAGRTGMDSSSRSFIA